jgi:hypothetical protein
MAPGTLKKAVVLRVSKSSTAFQVIADGYRALDTAEERGNWHEETIGLEENKSEVLKVARAFGMTIQRV